jgi:crotonobetainyl-CoA:carnitine CoA-transferase CaiB-like acyl-CoA transferase
MVENFVGLMGPAILDYTHNGRVPASIGNRDYTAVQGCYLCATSDRWLVLTLPDDAAWAAFCRAAGDPPGWDDPRFATPESRYANHDAVDDLIAAWTGSLTREEAVDRLRREGLIAGPVNDDADLMADPHLAARGYFMEVDHADAGRHRYPGPPYRFQEAPLAVRLPPARLGEHNEYVYKTLLGIGDEEFAELERRGHIGMDYAPEIR